MQLDLLQGLANNIKKIAAETFSMPSLLLRDIQRDNEEISITLFPACKIRKRPFIVLLSGSQIMFLNALLGIGRFQKAREIVENLAKRYNFNKKNISINLEGEDVHIACIIDTRMPIRELENILKEIFSFIKDAQATLQENFRELSLEYYGSLIIEFFGRKYTLVPTPLDESIASIGIGESWLPYTIITLPNAKGKFFCSDTGIDYLSLPSLSLISNDLENCYVYLPDNSQPPNLKAINISEQIRKLKTLLGSEYSIEDFINEKFLRELLKNVIEKLYTASNNSAQLSKVSLRPRLESITIENKSESAVSPNNYTDDITKLKEIITIIKEIMYLMSSAKRISKELEKIIISRTLLSLISNNGGLVEPKIIIGNTLESEVKKVTKNKKLYLSVKDLIKNGSNIVKIEKIKTANGDIIYVIRG
ncbi:MAG: hypothetical protein ACTSX9_09135 [Candidatus Njordarchaeales archaeon]